MLRIRDLQTTGLLYYDAAFSDRCWEFCEERDIDALPALDDPTVYYQRAADGFEKAGVEPERRIGAEMKAFAPNLLALFEKHKLLFVYEGRELTGVVHFSDYNRPAVSQYLYGELLAYERALRALATAQGYTHEDIRTYYAAKVEKEGSVDKNGGKAHAQQKLEEYERDKDKIAQVPAFQYAYLNDLLTLLNHKLKLKLQVKVNDLRKMVMHARDFVDMADVETDDYIYTIESFARFFTAVGALHHDKRRVENRLAFL